MLVWEQQVQMATPRHPAKVHRPLFENVSEQTDASQRASFAVCQEGAVPSHDTGTASFGKPAGAFGQQSQICPKIKAP